MAKYIRRAVSGLMVVINSETGQAICEPVKDGLAWDILRVANSGVIQILDLKERQCTCTGTFHDDKCSKRNK